MFERRHAAVLRMVEQYRLAGGGEIIRGYRSMAAGADKVVRPPVAKAAGILVCEKRCPDAGQDRPPIEQIMILRRATID